MVSLENPSFTNCEQIQIKNMQMPVIFHITRNLKGKL